MMRNHFVAGLLIWVPLAITLWVLNLIVSSMDRTVALLPLEWQPRQLLGMDLPGLGVVLTALVVLLTGVFATNLVGARLVALGERVLARIPIVRGIYSGVKQVSDTVLSPQGNAFRQALLVQYPRAGVWTIAFRTGLPASAVLTGIGPDARSDDFVSVYVPTTPNPTSGFFLVMRRTETVALDMSVDAALRHVLSMGVVAPPAAPPGPAVGAAEGEALSAAHRH